MLSTSALNGASLAQCRPVQRATPAFVAANQLTSRLHCCAPLSSRAPSLAAHPRQTAVHTYAAAAAAPVASPQAAKQKIRIKLKAYVTELLNESVEQIMEAATSTGATVSGPVPLPTRKRIYTVLRSPHVNKDSREQFEIRTHQRLLDIKNLSAVTVDRLMQLDLPAGVDVEVKL